MPYAHEKHFHEQNMSIDTLQGKLCVVWDEAEKGDRGLDFAKRRFSRGLRDETTTDF
jgi:hypothetical protein